MRLAIFLFFIGVAQHLTGQIPGLVSFDKLPQNLQLFARDSNNSAHFEVVGRCSQAHYTKLSSKLYKDGKLLESKDVTINTGTFGVAHKIEAGLHNYSLKVFIKAGADSLLAAQVEKIVCGDVFLIYGQSNAAPYRPGFVLENEFIRSYGVNNYEGASTSYNPADTLFTNNHEGGGSIGVWAVTMIDYLVKTHKVPILAISSSYSGTSIASMTRRDYGRFHLYDKQYYKVSKAGVKNKIKAIFFRQGESDVVSDEFALAWADSFKKLLKLWEEDYGKQPEIYVSQLDISVGSTPQAPKMRDFQRRITELGPKLHSYTLVGTENFDGLHYSSPGYIQTGLELGRIVSHELYRAPLLDQNIYSPNIKKAFYSADNKSIRLIFDENQNLTFDRVFIFRPLNSNELTVNFLKDNFIFDNKPSTMAISNAIAQGNSLTLELQNGTSPKRVSYLPSSFNPAEYPFFPGPFLKNSLGMRAFAFVDMEIGQAMDELKGFVAKNDARASISLSWAVNNSATSYQIYRRSELEPELRPYTVLGKNANTFLDKNVTEGLRYFYKIKAENNLAESNSLETSVLVADLSTPTLFTVNSIDESKQELRWVDNALDEEYYNLEVATNVNFENKKEIKLAPNSNSYSFENLEPSKTYYYRVRAYRPKVNRFTAYSNAAQGTTCPRGVTMLGARTDAGTKLSWKDNSPDEQSFEIKATEVATGSFIIQLTAANTEEALIAGLKDGTTYSLAVTAISNACRSKKDSVAITTPLEAPKNLNATATGIYTIKLSWTDASQAEEAVEIFEIKNGSDSLLAVLPGGSSSFVAEKLQPNSPHSYKIRNANKAAKYSVFSNESGATTLLITPNEPLLSRQIQVGPNPNNGLVHIILDKPYTITQVSLYNLKGQQILQSSFSGSSFTLNLPQLGSQRYLLQLLQGGVFHNYYILKN